MTKDTMVFNSPVDPQHLLLVLAIVGVGLNLVIFWIVYNLYQSLATDSAES
jgi:hypothetical protein